MSPLVTIGIPVYNGEKFIRNRLDSILSQTFDKFEIIISDNASTDSTEKIIQEYVKKDKRIKYFRQKKNLGLWNNFNFILEKAKTKYFAFAAVDDVFQPEFIEKNIRILESNEDIVCSVSKIKLFGERTNLLKYDSNTKYITKKKKKFLEKFGYMDTFPTSGKYEERVNQYLKNIKHNQIFYGVYRTEQIKKSIIKKSFMWNDSATSLNVLKYGNFYVVDQVLMKVYDGGMSRTGMIHATKGINRGIGRIFPYFRFTVWCIKNLNLKIFLKNFFFFFNLNMYGGFSICLDILRKIRSA